METDTKRMRLGTAPIGLGEADSPDDPFKRPVETDKDYHTRRTSDGLNWGLGQVKAPGRPIIKIPFGDGKG